MYPRAAEGLRTAPAALSTVGHAALHNPQTPSAQRRSRILQGLRVSSTWCRLKAVADCSWLLCFRNRPIQFSQAMHWPGPAAHHLFRGVWRQHACIMDLQRGLLLRPVQEHWQQILKCRNGGAPVHRILITPPAHMGRGKVNRIKSGRRPFDKQPNGRTWQWRDEALLPLEFHFTP